MVLPPQLRDMQILLTSWKTTVTELRRQHQWLLFISVPKLLQIYRLIQREEGSDEEEKTEEYADKLIREMMLLISNNPDSRAELKAKIKVLEGLLGFLYIICDLAIVL